MHLRQEAIRGRKLSLEEKLDEVTLNLYHDEKTVTKVYPNGRVGGRENEVIREYYEDMKLR